MTEDAKTGQKRPKCAIPGVRLGGRQKGTGNKTTTAVKEAILRAFEKVGGEDYLVTVAKEDHKTFCSLLGRVLPLEVSGSVDGTITVNITRFGDDNDSTV